MHFHLVRATAPASVDVVGKNRYKPIIPWWSVGSSEQPPGTHSPLNTSYFWQEPPLGPGSCAFQRLWTSVQIVAQNLPVPNWPHYSFINTQIDDGGKSSLSSTRDCSLCFPSAPRLAHISGETWSAFQRAALTNTTFPFWMQHGHNKPGRKRTVFVPPIQRWFTYVTWTDRPEG